MDVTGLYTVYVPIWSRTIFPLSPSDPVTFLALVVYGTGDPNFTGCASQGFFSFLSFPPRILLEQFSSGTGSIDTDSVEVLYNWTFEKFCSRLQIMQEVWQAHSQDPENFDLGEFNHPWSEQGQQHHSVCFSQRIFFPLGHKGLTELDFAMELTIFTACII